MTRYIIISFNG